MCGIFGYFGRESSSIDVNAVLKSLSRRGPDNQGYHLFPNGIFAHSRLSIQDLSSNANQPLVDSSGKYCIVYNGEIYNSNSLKTELCRLGYKFSTNSDTEVILNGYIEWGVKIFSKLSGMFAFAIYNSESNRIVCARDPIGIKPLLYSFTGESFLFSSDIKTIIQSKSIAPKLNSHALFSILNSGSVTQPDTILESVHALMPAHYIEFDVKNSVILSHIKYKDPFSTQRYEPVTCYSEALSQFDTLFENAISSQLVGDVEVGCFLSGGLDSSAILAYMQPLLENPIRCYTLSFGDCSEVSNEASAASAIASHFQSSFHQVNIAQSQLYPLFLQFIEAIDQPSIDGFNTFLISSIASLDVKVVLSGLGVTIFGGYPHFSLISQALATNSSLSSRLGRFVHYLRPNRFTYMSNLIGRSPEESIRLVRQIYSYEKAASILKSASIDKSMVRNDSISENLYSQLSIFELSGYLLNTLLRDSDSVSMNFGLELRPVLLDESIVQFGLSLPDHFKHNDGISKRILFDTLKKRLPVNLLSQKKSGFDIPFRTFINHTLSEYILPLWSTYSARKLFTSEFLEKLVSKTINQSLSRTDWLFVVIISWCEMYSIEID